jgi:dTDP-L-rhamnose 4-epimerase
LGENKNEDLKNILITGGAGFIGSNLALQLIGLDYQVTVLDNLSSQIHGENPEDSSLYQSIKGKVNFIKGDLCNREDVEKSIENQDAIIHLAAETGTGQSMYSVEKYSQVNLGGTALLLDILINKKNKVQKFILASSRAVYGEGKYANFSKEEIFPESREILRMKEGNFELVDEANQILRPLPTDENSKLNPTSYYGLTKLQQEEMVKMVCKNIGINYVILRYQNVFGAGQSLLNPYTGILSIFSTQILTGNSLNIFEDGKMTRDFIHIDDTIEATIKSLELKSANNETINVGTGIANTVLSIAEILFKSYKKESNFVITGDFRVGDIRHNFADLTMLKKTLNFKPKVTLEKGIHEFTTWVLEQPISENNFQKSLEEIKEKGFMKS